VNDDQTLAAIRVRAKQLADDAPPFTTEQAQLLRALWSRYPKAPATDSEGAA
jgi:hypothetical protein